MTMKSNAQNYPVRNIKAGQLKVEDKTPEAKESVSFSMEKDRGGRSVQPMMSDSTGLHGPFSPRGFSHRVA
jgi:hypothetical protein